MLSALLLLVVQTASAAEQPIGFSHTAHIEKASMQCTDCHEGATSRDSAGLPSIRKCMLCHQFIATDLPEVVRLSEYWERKHEVPWERIYGFAKTAAVQFRHAPHARAENRLLSVPRRRGVHDGRGQGGDAHHGLLHSVPPRQFRDRRLPGMSLLGQPVMQPTVPARMRRDVPAAAPCTPLEPGRSACAEAS